MNTHRAPNWQEINANWRARQARVAAARLAAPPTAEFAHIHWPDTTTVDYITAAEADRRTAAGQAGTYVDLTPEDEALTALKRRYGIAR